MLQLIKKTLMLTVVSTITIFLLSYILYREFSLLAFINISFVLASIFIFFYLLLFVTKAGFFDAITYSFRKFTKHHSKTENFTVDDLEEMKLPSDIFTQKNTTPILFSGLCLLLIMLLSLVFYY